MKKLHFFMVLIAIAAFSCSKDSMPEILQDQGDMASNAVMKGSGTVIEVAPGPDDTQALIDAFAEASAAGKGSVIKLLPGTFEIGMIEVREFSGTLTGSGKGNTIITNLPDIPPPVELIMVLGKQAALMSFIGGDVSISDLSFQLTDMPWLVNGVFNMLLFSDYSPDFMPAIKYIRILLENIEITGIRNADPPNRPYPVTGVRISPDVIRDAAGEFPRSNIDATVTNSTISTLNQGIYVWGCKSGNLRFGTEGGNIFHGNNKGLLVNENLGMNVKIFNNVFNTPSRHGNGIDLNTGEEALNLPVPLEVIETDAGTYEIRNNTFNVTGPANAIGLMDAWRLAHPEYPTWMKMIWQDNKFILNNQGAFLGWTYCIKNILFQKNIITGNDVPYSRVINTNFYWTTSLPNNTSEGCKFINNHFLRKNFIFYIDLNVNNYELVGDFTDVIINDFGEGTRIIGKTNPNHARGTIDHEMSTLKERTGEIYY